MIHVSGGMWKTNQEFFENVHNFFDFFSLSELLKASNQPSGTNHPCISNGLQHSLIIGQRWRYRI